MKLLLFAFNAFLTITVNAQYCTSNDRFTEIDYFEINELDSTSNAIYGYAEDYEGNEDTLILDVFFPDNLIDTMALRPAVMMMHGGGFKSGSKESRQNESIAMARRGYVVFNINYRIGWDTTNPINQIYAAYRANQDARAAMRYIVEQKDTYRVDTNWIFVAGSSAGAINAFHLAYSDQNEWNSLLPGVETQLGNLNTSTNNLAHEYSIKGIFNNWGSTFTGMAQANELLPTISFHGDQDGTVAIDTSTLGSLGSRALYNFNLDNGVCSDLSVVNGGGHGVYVGIDGAYFRSSKASCFFKSIFCNYCTDVYTTDSIPASCSQVTDIEEEWVNDEIKVYPNPFNSKIRIENIAIGAKIEVTSISGQIVLRENYLGDSIDLADVQSGIYLMQIFIGSKARTIRIIKE